jgi:predicted dehydrogenase
MPWFIPSRALGKDDAVAPSERISLGAIGIGPRGNTVLQGMLAEPDVQFLAICDVRADRRESVKATADAHYGNTDCAMFRALREPWRV